MSTETAVHCPVVIVQYTMIPPSGYLVVRKLDSHPAFSDAPNYNKGVVVATTKYSHFIIGDIVIYTQGRPLPVSEPDLYTVGVKQITLALREVHDDILT